MEIITLQQCKDDANKMDGHEQLRFVYLLALETLSLLPEETPVNRGLFSPESANYFLQSHRIVRCPQCRKYYLNIISYCHNDKEVLLFVENEEALLQEWERVRAALANIDGHVHTPQEAIDWYWRKSIIGKEYP